ncbi:MAG: hypothetical protein C0456_06325 [Hyphomonas sp.]|nr:hypothetical protein [Hyphomonas sp.]
MNAIRHDTRGLAQPSTCVTDLFKIACNPLERLWADCLGRVGRMSQQSQHNTTDEFFLLQEFCKAGCWMISFFGYQSAYISGLQRRDVG